MQNIDQIRKTLKRYNNLFLSDDIKIENNSVLNSKNEIVGVVEKNYLYLNYRKKTNKDLNFIENLEFTNLVINNILKDSDQVVFKLKGRYDIDSTAILSDEYKIEFDCKFELSEKLTFSNFILQCKNKYFEDRLSSRALYFQTEVKINNKDLLSKWYIGYNNEISVNIESTDVNNDIVNLVDIASLVGLEKSFDFNDSFNFSIKKINTSFSFADNKPQINSVEFTGQVTGILDDLKFEVGFKYHIQSKISLFNIKLLETITIKDLLEKLGISKSHLESLSWLDNVSINSFELNLSSKNSYSVIIEVDFEDISIEIGDYHIKPKDITLNIIKEKNYEISFEITGEIFKDEESIQTSGSFKYDKTDGFTFDFSIYDLDVFQFISIEKPDFIDIVKANELTIGKHSSGFEIKGELSCEFGLPFKYHSNGEPSPQLDIKHFEYTKTDGFKLVGEVKNFICENTFFEVSKNELKILCNKIDILSIVKNICGFNGNPNLKKTTIDTFSLLYNFNKKQLIAGVNNLDVDIVGLQITDGKLCLSISKQSVSFTIGGQIDFLFKNENLKFEGNLNFSNSGISLSAEVKGQIKVLENLSIIDPSLEVLIQPNSQGIGLYGMLIFNDKIVNGLVYVDLLKPEFQLIGINFNGINFTEIISDILGAENNPIPGEISLMPTKVNEDIWKVEKNKSTYKGYTLYVDRENFYVYEERSNPVEYYKYVHFYESTVSVELFKTNYTEGISFSGLITIFDASVVMDFSAIRNKGIKGEVSFNQPIKIGEIIELSKSKFDNSPNSLGPYLKISTYLDDPYFNFSCNLDLLGGLLCVDTFININKSALHIEAEAKIWQYYLYFKMISNYGDFSSGMNLSLDVVFRSGGFTAITQKISQELKKEADNVTRTLEEKKRKIAEYNLQINKYIDEINSLGQDIDYCQNRIYYLNNLSFDWYESYKYIPIYAEIGGYSVRIGADWTAKNIAIGLLEVAKQTLKLIDTITDLTGEAYLLALKGISVLTEIIANTLDWVFSVREIVAHAAVSNDSLYFEGKIDYKLLGVDYNEDIKFYLSKNQDKNNLDSKIETLSEKAEKSKDINSGNFTFYQPKKIKYFTYANNDYDKENNFYEDMYTRSDLKSLLNNLEIFQTIINNNSIDHTFIRDYSSSTLKDISDTQPKNLFEHFSDLEEYQARSEKRLNNWDNQRENLQEFESIIENVNRNNSLGLTENKSSKEKNLNRKIAKLSKDILNSVSDLNNKYETTKKRSSIYAYEKLNVNHFFGGSKFTIDNKKINYKGYVPDKNTENLLNSYLCLYKDKNVDVYMKSIIAYNIALIYKELDDPNLVKRFKRKSLELMRQYISFKSDFYKDFRKKVNNS